MLTCAETTTGGNCSGKMLASGADMKIKIEKPTERDIASMTSCPVWTKEQSVFDWEYDSSETCYLLEGEVRVTTADGDAVEFGAGDLVTFPAGLRCQWEVRKPVRKHYRFG